METMNERIAATKHAETKCDMCLGRKSDPLVHCCGRIKEAFHAGAAWSRRYDAELQLQLSRELKAEREATGGVRDESS